MAVINMERLAQLKKEKDLEIEVQNNLDNIWIDSVKQRIERISGTAKDLHETYRYFVQNKLNASVFELDGYSISFSEWSEYSRYKDHIRYKASDSSNVLFFYDKNSIVIDRTSFGFNPRYFATNEYFKSAVEELLLKLESYCKIMVERLNNL